MIYNLIADAGSTKVSWAITDTEGNEIKRFATDGLNALLATDEELAAMVTSVLSQIPENSEAHEIHYYGAGCATEEICSRISSALADRLNPHSSEVQSDLLGAARSLLGRDGGIACILGTGSNSCLYDGEKIVHNVPSLGFILGDEGSGAALGKRLLTDTLKGRLPRPVTEKFIETYKITTAEVLDRVYRRQAPSKWLASFVPFLSENIWNPYIYSLIRKEFENFLTRNVSAYQGSRTLPISFTGGIAYNFADVLRQTGESHGYKIGRITAQPLDGLIDFHKN